MHGYEVKGDGDTLQRVANQLRCYGEVYDFVTFIVTEKHLSKLLPLLPDWVGVLVASAAGLRPHRPAGYNATVALAPIAKLVLLEDVNMTPTMPLLFPLTGKQPLSPGDEAGPPCL